MLRINNIKEFIIFDCTNFLHTFFLFVSLLIFAPSVIGAACTEVNPNGTIAVSSTPITECTSWVLLDTLEYQENNIIPVLFTVNDTQELVQMFTVGFSGVMLCYLVGYITGVIVNQFKEDR